MSYSILTFTQKYYSTSLLFTGITFLSLPGNPVNPQNIDAVLKGRCIILYALKYPYQTYSKDSLTN